VSELHTVRTREELADAERGMRWWNELPEYSRSAWLKHVDSARPADAWAAYKATLEREAKALRDTTHSPNCDCDWCLEARAR
jgi:hypothetical protein